MDKEEIIKKYFAAWIKKDVSVLRQVFSEDIIYSECYGPEYDGIGQILVWFKEWNKQGDVLEWNIKRFIHQNNIVVVEWYFKCDYRNEIDGFDGVSIVEFDDDIKIKKLSEFQSKAEHIYPYAGV